MDPETEIEAAPSPITGRETATHRLCREACLEELARRQLEIAKDLPRRNLAYRMSKLQSVIQAIEELEQTGV